MKHYEFKFVRVDKESELNASGADGWTAVGIVPATYHSGYVLMQRELPSLGSKIRKTLSRWVVGEEREARIYDLLQR